MHNYGFITQERYRYLLNYRPFRLMLEARLGSSPRWGSNTAFLGQCQSIRIMWDGLALVSPELVSNSSLYVSERYHCHHAFQIAAIVKVAGAFAIAAAEAFDWHEMFSDLPRYNALQIA